jgi:hypothetical protein
MKIAEPKVVAQTIDTGSYKPDEVMSCEQHFGCEKITDIPQTVAKEIHSAVPQGFSQDINNLAKVTITVTTDIDNDAMELDVVKASYKF